MMLAAAPAAGVPPMPDHTDTARILADTQANLGESLAESAHEEGTRLNPNDAAESARSHLADKPGTTCRPEATTDHHLGGMPEESSSVGFNRSQPPHHEYQGWL